MEIMGVTSVKKYIIYIVYIAHVSATKGLQAHLTQDVDTPSAMHSEVIIAAEARHIIASLMARAPQRSQLGCAEKFQDITVEH